MGKILMNWIWEVIFYLLIVYTSLQFLVSGPVLQLLINFFPFDILNLNGSLSEYFCLSFT
ncbi:hypothetical protein LEP1GSC158_5154 [Leptospira interrogans serovar Zanoni str. LT2156]|uniref:Uncharacterized protein n=1 Tax=Leptospira interrogans serovar Zanoni str. LT2156 TaxID=1001601 RepID=M6HES8_LEPIR|nr:hypothetical protein LEP1GSC158_5154 [Leptospira interrogans serovar Zanoni str. LT2156]